MNEDFPNCKWIKAIIGILMEDGTIVFEDYPKLKVRINLPGTFPEFSIPKTWSWVPQDGCIVGDWKSGDEIRFSMFRSFSGWEGPSLSNSQSSIKSVLTPSYAIVEGWEETFKEHRFEKEEFKE